MIAPYEGTREQENKRTREQENKGTREQGNRWPAGRTKEQMEEPRTEQKNKRTNGPLGEQGDKKDIHALDTTTSLQVHLLPTTTITMHESGTKRGT
jgi:hypothetical protein